MPVRVRIKRVYLPAVAADGHRVLVDRMWPRGLRKVDVKIDHWCRDCAPSEGLRRWFDHDATKWPEFRRRYLVELAESRPQTERCFQRNARGTITLVYGAKDESHNQAVVLKEFLETEVFV